MKMKYVVKQNIVYFLLENNVDKTPLAYRMHVSSVHIQLMLKIKYFWNVFVTFEQNKANTYKD